MRDLGFWKKYAFGENSENFQFFCVFWVIINSIHTSFIYISHVLCVFEIRRHISHFEKRVKSKFPIICLFFSSSRWGCVHCFRLSKSDINKTHHHGHKQLKNAWNHQHINSEPNISKNSHWGSQWGNVVLKYRHRTHTIQVKAAAYLTLNRIIRILVQRIRINGHVTIYCVISLNMFD